MAGSHPRVPSLHAQAQPLVIYPQVAVAAADHGDLYALPHADGRWLWRAKRLVPGAFQKALVPRLVAAGQRRFK